MKIHLDFKGVPILFKALNRQKEFDLVLRANSCTLRDVVDLLTRKFGVMVKKALLDEKGDIDLEIRVVVNHNINPSDNRMGAVIKDGDVVAFLGAS